jgi:excisionase family DNA binding protein
MDDWITTAEAAQISGYHVDHVRRLIRARKLKARKWMRDWQVSRQSISDYLDQMEKHGEKRGPKPSEN